MTVNETSVSESSTIRIILNLPRLICTKYEQLNEYLLTHSDPRTRNRFLVGRMDAMVAITSIYLIFLWIGPKLMRNRRAFNLRPIMGLHNFAVSSLSVWIVYEMLVNIRISKYDYLCNPYRVSYAPSDLRIVQVGYVYYILKAVELFDTVYMILKKNQHKVTFMHVYHHAFMFSATYFACILAPCCQGVAVVIINSFVHIIMYAYYGLSSFPGLQKFLWWKKYLTQLQLVQFVSLVTVQGISFFKGCDYPKELYYSYLPFAITQTFLFANYYVKSHHHSQQFHYSRESSTVSKKSE